MDDLLETASRCPHCRAGLRPGAPWCTLCHADLRPPQAAPQPEPVAAAPVVPRQPSLDPLTVPAAALGLPPRPGSEPSWPCSGCGTGNPIAANACLSCGTAFLAGLREAEGPLLELPGVGDLTLMSRGQRLGIALGVVAAFIVLTALLGLALG